ncbi:MAG: hypothetical protein ACI814_001226 [Mariniblastus sp.]|jgi:hypothetical protein
MNGIDIGRFPFEFDLTWMSFFQTHQGRTLLRYGGRDDSSPESQLNQPSLVSAMKDALRLYEAKQLRPVNQYEPANATAFTPDDIPSIPKMLSKRQVKCIHCHDVKHAQLAELRKAGTLTKAMVFSYPSPSNLGIQLDPKQQNQIKSLTSDSTATSAGLRPGDVLQALGGQPVLTYADVTRVLELAADEGKITMDVTRTLNAKPQSLSVELPLPKGWKTLGDPSWRESTHVVGPNSGFWAVTLSKTERKNLKLDDEKLGLRATAIWGQWAKQAGVKHGDIIIAIDGRTDDMGIKQLQTHLQMNRNWGDTVSLTVLRKRKPMVLSMKLPPQPKD